MLGPMGMDDDDMSSEDDSEDGDSEFAEDEDGLNGPWDAAAFWPGMPPF